jgi:hypothetical protein
MIGYVYYDRWNILVGSKMLSFINYRLWISKKIHNEFIGGLDVIMTYDFY